MKYLLLTTFLFFTSSLFAQVDTASTWKRGGTITINVSQVSLQNWAAGGQNSISGSGLLNLFLNYKTSEASWDNSADLGYGLLKLGKNDLIKSDDRIDLSSKYGRHAFKNWFYSSLINFRTQFSAGYNYPNDSVRISDFMSPGYGLLAIGLDYKPADNFTLMLAPLTGKFTIVSDQTLADAGAYGVDPAEYDDAGKIIQPGDNLRKELGGYLKLLHRLKIMENVTLQSKLDLFSNYLNNPGNIDVNLEVLLTMKVNKYLGVNLLGHLIYDDDIRIPVDEDDDGIIDTAGPRTQIKEVLNIGISYKF